MFKVSLGSFGTFPIFPIFNNLVSQKRLVEERNGPKFGPRGYLFGVHKERLTFKCLGHSVRLFGAFPISAPLYLQNG